MEEILDRIETTLALAGYDIVETDAETGTMQIYDKSQDLHYRITIEN